MNCTRDAPVFGMQTGASLGSCSQVQPYMLFLPTYMNGVDPRLSGSDNKVLPILIFPIIIPLVSRA